MAQYPALMHARASRQNANRLRDDNNGAVPTEQAAAAAVGQLEKRFVQGSERFDKSERMVTGV